MGPCCWWSVIKAAEWWTWPQATCSPGTGRKPEPGSDAARRAALGIGPLDGAWIGVCGLAGGELPGATADGWQARASGDGVTVSAPGRQPLVVSESEEMRAFGFSPDGTTFIIATSPGLAN